MPRYQSFRLGSMDYTPAPQMARRRTASFSHGQTPRYVGMLESQNRYGRGTWSAGRSVSRWAESFNVESDEDSYYPPGGRRVYYEDDDPSSDEDVVHVSFKFSRRSKPPIWAQQPQYVYQTQPMPMPMQYQNHPAEIYEPVFEPSRAVQVFDAPTAAPPQPLVAQMPPQHLQPNLSVLPQPPTPVQSPYEQPVISSPEKPDANYEVPPDTVPRYRQGGSRRRHSFAESNHSSVRSKANSLQTGSHRQWRKLVYYIPVDKEGNSLPATGYHVRPEVLENLLKQGIMEEKELEADEQSEQPDRLRKEQKKKTKDSKN